MIFLFPYHSLLQLQRPKLKGLDYELLQHLVRTNDKKRYQLLDEDGVKLIRAVQGHTLDTSDLELTQILKPSDASIAVHGTNPDAWNKISMSFTHYSYLF